MELLIFRPSFDAIAGELARRDVQPVIMEASGDLVTPGGQPCPDARPEAAWLSRELLVPPGGPIGRFLKQIHAGSVRWVQSSAAGYEHPIFKQILDAGIRLSTSDATAVAIAEFVLAEVLASCHPLNERRAAQQAHRWQRFDFRELQGSRWLIIGYGHIGAAVAQRATAFGARVTGVRRTPRPSKWAEQVVSINDLDAHLPSADIVVISAAANTDNNHLLNAERLARLQPASTLVNIARGSLIDGDALLRSLDQSRPGLAILDVFETEPLPANSPFWDHPRVRLSAHCSADSDGTVRRGNKVFLEHLDAWLASQPLRLEVREEREAWAHRSQNRPE